MKSMFVLGHRGAPDRFHENTLESFRAAMEQGADGVELDVRETADGKFVVHHDPCVPGLTIPIEYANLGLIRKCRLPGKLIVPTLEEALESVGPDAKVIVELKGRRASRDLRRVLDAASCRTRVCLSSFNHRMVASAAGTRYPFALTFGSQVDDAVAKAVRLGASELHLKYTFVNRHVVQKAHANGIAVMAWTVNSIDQATRLRDLEVDGVITDRPDTLLNLAHRKND